MNNPYIQYIENYIKENTPLPFLKREDKYQEMVKALTDHNLTDYIELVASCYSLFYTGLDYHLNAYDNPEHLPYAILLGDFISSYVAEILYKHQQFELLKTFAHTTKEIMLNLLNGTSDDNLLVNIINTLKSRCNNGFS
ncbi:MAG: hypothetical protein GX676_07805 [Bacilli bacterium]|nr:hypothetical protein [Bacilli bacterium]